jgi:FkbM family methyltransferase
MIKNIGTRDRISVNEMALGSTVGKAYVHEGFSDLTHSISSSVNTTYSKAKEEVYLETIDTYVARKKIEEIDLLKVDTEGHEIEVLKGADTTIKGGRIKAIFAECDFRREDKQHTYFPDLLEYLHEKDFTFFGLYDVIHYGENYGVGYCNALFLNGEASHPNNNL